MGAIFGLEYMNQIYETTFTIKDTVSAIKERVAWDVAFFTILDIPICAGR